MTPSRTPLRDRIAARRGTPVARPPEPVPATEPRPEPWRPVWLDRLTAKDTTGRVLS